MSFSMPFLRPPNMIPSVDELAVQDEFSLKQIDPPMPEAPWVRRCKHQIRFTTNVNQSTTLKFFAPKMPLNSERKPEAKELSLRSRIR